MGKETKYTDKLTLTIEYVYNTLKEAGYDDISIAGILGNALLESSLNPDSVSSNKLYHGLFQNSSNIRKAIESQYGDYSIDSQLKYLMDWNDKADWITNGPSKAYTSTGAGKFKKTGYKTAREAGEAFMKLYERPVIVENGKIVGYQHAANRLANSDLMHNYVTLNYTIPNALDPYTLRINIQPIDALQVNQIVPESQVRHTYDGAENISPYITGKPMLRILPRLELPTVEELMELTQWQPKFNISPRL